MALVDEHKTDEMLRVDGFGLSIGSVSVGLPRACTADAVLLRYIDLIRLVGNGRAVPEDVDALATATRLDAKTVRRRLERLRS